MAARNLLSSVCKIHLNQLLNLNLQRLLLSLTKLVHYRKVWAKESPLHCLQKEPPKKLGKSKNLLIMTSQTIRWKNQVTSNIRKRAALLRDAQSKSWVKHSPLLPGGKRSVGVSAWPRRRAICLRLSSRGTPTGPVLKSRASLRGCSSRTSKSTSGAGIERRRRIHVMPPRATIPTNSLSPKCEGKLTARSLQWASYWVWTLARI